MMDILEEENFDDEKFQSESKESVDYDTEEIGGHGEDYESNVDSVPPDIDEETLRQMERDFCLIRLSWPEIDLGDTWAAQLPLSYRTVSDKEKNLLYHAEHFRKQYHTVYPDRKPLLLACDNECGVQKFVSTSIRPSTLPYPELHTWQGCANFVSDHLEYEIPERPLHMPVMLRSPTWLMTFQRGNAFEYATLLVSFLLGKGYNAFVVSGYASREQVFCDMTMQTCPYLMEEEEPQAVLEATDTPRYKIKSPPDFRSQLLLELEAREAKKIQEELEKLEKERVKMLLEQERPLPDDFWGNRIHAWVLILPESGGPRHQEIDKAFFIEPTSGFSYFPDQRETKLLYQGIESLWNDKNYWVNMQTCEEGCFTLDWDLNNTDNWERLLPRESGFAPGVSDEVDVDEDDRRQQDKHLEMPFSYVENIELQSLDFERRYPNGTKTVLFKKTKVDFYAPYVQMDGLVRKITIYEDYEYKFPLEVNEKYLNRTDMLIESKKIIDTCAAIDSYKRGRADACTEHQYSTNGNDRIDEERTLNFFHSIRFDGLTKIETDPLHLTQHFVGRKDFLYYRHVEYSKDEENNHKARTVSRIIEKYNRNENIPASSDVAIRDFDLVKNQIILHYHYEKNRVTRAMKRFMKPSVSESGEHPAFNLDLIQGYNPDPLATPEKLLSIYYELEKQLKDESDCLTLVRDVETEVLTFLRKRSSEYIMPKLSVSLFDRNRNEEAKAKMLAQEELLKAQTEKEVELESDYLGPYLARLGNPSPLTKAQATYVRNECLNDLKKLLADRANHISRTFDECSKELNQVQNWLTESDGKTREEEEELLNLTNDINFHLHTLDVRLQRHCELAPERYRKMLMTLKADQRLACLACE